MLELLCLKIILCFESFAYRNEANQLWSFTHFHENISPATISFAKYVTPELLVHLCLQCLLVYKVESNLMQRILRFLASKGAVG